MGLAEGNVPLRKDGQIETRPLEVEEWLETLPYADFQRTATLLHEVLAATNKVPLKAGTREELLALYDQPYRYYLQSQISTGAQHTLASMESMQKQLRLMKQLAADLALMSQQIINDAGKSKSLWGRKPPVAQTRQALAYLSQALIFNFIEYGPTPRNVWKQLHSLYRYAESIERLHTTVALPEGGQSTIAHTYGRILLTELVDPYHLPFGAIWEIYEQVDDWLASPALAPFEPPPDATGMFVVDLDSDSPATPLDRFDNSNAGPSHRLLDARPLHARVQQTLERIGKGETPALKLSASYRPLLLDQMNRAWSVPPKRYLPRARSSGELPVTCGLKPTHFHMNGGRDSLSAAVPDAGAEGLDVDDGPAAVEVSQTGSHFALEQWNLLNESSGGCALGRRQRPVYSVRVGELLGLRHADEKGARQWRLGIVRWLMIDSQQQYRMGIQLLGSASTPVTVLADGAGAEPQRGFRIRHGDGISLITARGVLAPEQTVELRHGEGSEKLQTRRRLETLPGFEHYLMQAS